MSNRSTKFPLTDTRVAAVRAPHFFTTPTHDQDTILRHFYLGNAHTHTHTHTKLTCTGKWPPVTCSISVTNLCASTASFDLLSLSRVLLNIQISGGKMADFVVLAALPLQLFNLCRVSGNGIIQ